MNCLAIMCRLWLSSEEGQDIIEYALVIALIAFGAVAGMGVAVTEINTTFNTLTGDLASSL
jgi:pilus assembly protein Flp/PilA